MAQDEKFMPPDEVNRGIKGLTPNQHRRLARIGDRHAQGLDCTGDEL